MIIKQGLIGMVIKNLMRSIIEILIPSLIEWVKTDWIPLVGRYSFRIRP